MNPPEMVTEALRASFPNARIRVTDGKPTSIVVIQGRYGVSIEWYKGRGFRLTCCDGPEGDESFVSPLALIERAKHLLRDGYCRRAS